jgi:hypothetical protein
MAVTHFVAVVSSLLLVLVFTAVVPFGLGAVVPLGMNRGGRARHRRRA